MSKNKNVSKKVSNGTLVTVRDSDLEFGINTKKLGRDIRVAVVIDTNKNDELAILKQQHSKNKVIRTKDRSFNPNIKTKDSKGKNLKIDGSKIRKINDKKISKKEANELKRQALKEQDKNTRKPNRNRLKKLKGRK